MRYNFITIEGNIGAGKTTLSTRIAKDFGGKLILEEFADNPFLPKFYENKDKHAFALELSFLAERYQQLRDLLPEQDLFSRFTISDYYIFKSLIFAKNNLDEEEYRLFRRFFDIMYSMLPHPDVLVYLYLDVENLQRNIRKRGRPFEQSISDDYLIEVQRSYMDFLKQQPDQRILLVDTNGINFAENDDHYHKMLEIIQSDYPVGLHRISL